MSNEIQVAKKPTFTMTINSTGYKNLINKTLGDENRAKRFVAAITSAVVTNPQLQECDAQSIVSAGFLGESLNLSPSPQLGQYYFVPFNDNKNDRKVAQFQLGYKGYIQLALRSGQYKKLNVLAIKQDELISFDPLNEEINVKLIEDEEKRENAPTIGYYAMFEYLNGFRKAMYWSKAKMLSHADRYSKAFNKEAYHKLLDGKIPEKDLWKYSSFWYKDFDGMAFKTMLRQLISKWGVMSTEMQEAFEKDMATINNDGTYDYVDSPDTETTQPVIQTEPGEVVEMSVGEKDNTTESNKETVKKEVDINDI